MKKRRRLLEPPLSRYRDKNKRKRLPRRNGKSMSSAGSGNVMPGRKLEKEGARQQEEYNHEHRASGACPDPITDPLGWCKYEWSSKGTYVTCCPLPPEPSYLNFILYSPRLICLRGYKPVWFPATHLLPFVCAPGGHDDV